MNKTEREIQVIKFLNKCNIVFDDWYQLDNQIIPRDIFLSDEHYTTIQNDIKDIKKYYTSTALTSMQSNAKDKQKWYLLNLVRQMLRSNSYNMVPIRKADGYDLNKKKKYRRFFKLEKIKSVTEFKDSLITEEL